MSDNNAANYAQIALDEQLAIILTASEKGEWTAVDTALTKARELAANNRTLQKQLTAVEKESQDYRRAFVKNLLTEVGQQLNDSDSFDENAIYEMLDMASETISDEPKIAKLRGELANKLTLRHENQAYENAILKCKDLWKQEQDLLDKKVAGSDILERIYKEALRIAEKTASQYPDSMQMTGLINEAKFAYDKARDRYELRTTAEQTGDFKKMLEALQEEKEKIN